MADVLANLVPIIENYLKTDEVFHEASSIRGVVLNAFIKNYHNDLGITGDMITDRCAQECHVDWEDKKNSEKLEVINSAWNEWRYILGQMNFPKKPRVIP